MIRKLNCLVYSGGLFTSFLTNGSEHAKRLEYIFEDVDFKYRDKTNVSMQDAREADIIIGHPTREMLKEAINLKWLHVNAAGVNGFADRSLYNDPDNILVTRMADTFGIPMAEHTIGMMISLNRGFRRLDLQQRNNVWQSYRADKELYGSTVLMLGAGNLAGEIVKRLIPFGVKVIGVKRDSTVKPEGYESVYSAEQLHEALAQADYVIDSLPLTPETHHIMNAEAFAAMKTDSVFINIGRGATVDTEALITALNDGKLFAAGLDVTEPEPLNADSPLWQMENVMISAHCSALSGVEQTRRVNTIIKLMEQYFAGDDLDYMVDLDKGY